MTQHGRGDAGTDPPEGVEPLDHTADVGYEVTAGSLAGLTRAWLRELLVFNV